MPDERERFRRKRLRPLLLVLSLGGCQGAYLHNSSLETRTAAANADLEKVNVDAVFAAQARMLSDFAADESAEVTAFTTVLRDQAITDLIRPEPLDSSALNAADRLRDRVNEDLRRIYGTDALDDETLGKLSVLGRRRALYLERLENASTQYDAAAAEYLRVRPANDGRSVVCDSLAAPTGTTPIETHDILYEQIRLACDDLAIPDPIAGAGFATGSRLATDLDAVSMARAAANKGRSEVASIRADIQALERDARVDDRQGQFAAQIKALRDKLNEVAPVARVAGFDAIEQALQTALADELDASTAASAPEAQVQALLKLIAATEQAGDVFGSQPRIQRINALLVALAEARHSLRMAQLAVDREMDQLRLAEAKLIATAGQVSALAEARRLIDVGLPEDRAFATVRKSGTLEQRSTVGAALAAYADSWNVGEIPYQVLVFREVEIDRAVAVRQAALTAEDYRAVLQPALAEVAAYGAGGVRPEVVAQLLGNLGIVAAIGAK